MQINSIVKNIPYFGGEIVAEQNNKQKLKTDTNFSNTGTLTKNIYPNKTMSVYEKEPTLLNTSWYYVSDVHGKMTKIERMIGMTKEFDSTPASERTNFFNKEDKVSKFKVSSGDIILGDNYTRNQVANMLLNKGNFLATALGNHEVDNTDPCNLSRLIDESNYVMLAANVDINDKSPLKSRIKKSIITEKDGVKVGIIGVAPSDMYKRVKMNPTLSDMNVYDLEKTISTVEKEVENLKKQGINIIVLLSHSGSNNDRRLAQEIDGIDIIFGGHTHELYEGIKEGHNLLYSKSGEPVIITQIGKDGEHAGILNVSFDKNGVIQKAQNNIVNVEDYNRSLIVKKEVENILGKAEIIGKVSYADPAPKNRLLENNPHGNLIVDSMRHELNTDIGLLNAGNIRGVFSPGEIDDRLICDITPFADNMMILELTEPQIVNAIKVGCNSINKTTNKPGILLVSGLNYKYNKQGKLLELNYIDRDNKVHKIDVDNPNPNKKYTVAADDFFATGGDGFLESNEHPDFVLKNFKLDKTVLACDYIKKLNQPIEIRDDKRVVLVE